MIYLDHAATSPVRPAVWQAMQEVVGEADFNPASMHVAGGRAAAVLEAARATMAAAIEGPRAGVVFTGGGTQSDNLAVLGFARAREACRILVSAIEHKAVLQAAARARVEGAVVEVLPVDGNGMLLPDLAEDRLAAGGDRPALLSVMWANNETGVVQPVGALCEAAHRHGALFHTDAVQAFGKVPVSLRDVPADLLTLTAHKLGGPVGIGLLFRSPGIDLEPLAYGGDQEGSLWPGTQNPVGAAGFAAAARMASQELPIVAPRWAAMRAELETTLRQTVPEARFHCCDARDRLPNLLSVGLPGFDPAVFLTGLDLEQVAVSSGSACSSGAATGSHVLEAMRVVPEDPYAVLRFSFGPSTTEQDVRAAAAAVGRVAARLRDGGP